MMLSYSLHLVANNIYFKYTPEIMLCTNNKHIHIYIYSAASRARGILVIFGALAQIKEHLAPPVTHYSLWWRRFYKDARLPVN